MAAFFRKAVLFLAVLLVLFLSFLAFRCQLAVSGRRLLELKAQEEGLTETVTPVRFKLTARTADSISADFRFYDSSGAQTGKRSVTLPGQELHIDLAVYARADGSYSFLPYAVFSDRVAAADGILLADGTMQRDDVLLADVAQPIPDSSLAIMAREDPEQAVFTNDNEMRGYRTDADEIGRAHV